MIKKYQTYLHGFVLNGQMRDQGTRSVSLSTVRGKKYGNSHMSES